MRGAISRECYAAIPGMGFITGTACEVQYSLQKGAPLDLVVEYGDKRETSVSINGGPDMVNCNVSLCRPRRCKNETHTFPMSIKHP